MLWRNIFYPKPEVRVLGESIATWQISSFSAPSSRSWTSAWEKAAGPSPPWDALCLPSCCQQIMYPKSTLPRNRFIKQEPPGAISGYGGMSHVREKSMPNGVTFSQYVGPLAPPQADPLPCSSPFPSLVWRYQAQRATAMENGTVWRRRVTFPCRQQGHSWVRRWFSMTTVALGWERVHGRCVCASISNAAIQKNWKLSFRAKQYFSWWLSSFWCWELLLCNWGSYGVMTSLSIQHLASEMSKPFANVKELTFSTFARWVRVLVPVFHTRCFNAEICPRWSSVEAGRSTRESQLMLLCTVPGFFPD